MSCGRSWGTLRRHWFEGPVAIGWPGCQSKAAACHGHSDSWTVPPSIYCLNSAGSFCTCFYYPLIPYNTSQQCRRTSQDARINDRWLLTNGKWKKKIILSVMTCNQAVTLLLCMQNALLYWSPRTVYLVLENRTILPTPFLKAVQ